MAEPVRIVTAPLRAPGQPDFASLASVVAADALARQARGAGRPADLVVPVLAGELRSHYALDRELGREGHDHRSLGEEEYAARAARFAAEGCQALTGRLAALGVEGAVVHLAAGVAEVAGLSQTAFVTLYEQGLVDHVERVVGTCPRCRTPLDQADTAIGPLPGERLTVRLAGDAGGELEVVLDHPELLVGVVAVAVPEGHPAAGATVVLPVADRAVPVVADGARTEPGVVVPAHDPAAHGLALSAGLPAIPVLDGVGVVCAPGPLAGLARYAARAAARELLVAEGALVAAEPASEEVPRCAVCATAVVPRLGRHWLLRSADLELAAADAVRAGQVAFFPPEARDAFLGLAGAGPDWCLSSGLSGGVPVPAAACLDCGRLAVETGPAPSCGGCMGELVADGGTLDARFVAAAWALVLGGWPGRRPADPPPTTSVVSTMDDLARWVVPALALGLRLSGSLPFSQVTVHPWPRGEEPAPAGLLAGGVDRRVVRLALVAGTGDVVAADAAVAALDGPAGGPEADAAVAALDGPAGGPQEDAAVAAVVAAVAAALDVGTPAMAAGLLLSCLVAGVPAGAAGRLRALASPILGD